MGSYLVAVMGKTVPFGTFLVTARPGSYGGGYDRFLLHFSLVSVENIRREKTCNSDKTSKEKRETNRQLGDPICGGSWLFSMEFVCEIKRMETRQKDKEKETAPGDRNPKLRGVAKNHRT